MESALEVITVEATAPGSTSAPFPAVAGNSTVVRDADKAWLLGLWGKRHNSGRFQITSPLLHDAIVGIQARMHTSDVNTINLGCPQQLTPQDNLVTSGSGSGTAGEIEQNSYLVMYEGLAGIDGKLINGDELKNRAIELYDSLNVITAGTTGGYSGSEIISADQDQLKANQDYAILGVSLATNTSNIVTVRYTSPDWGNLGIGVPAMQENSWVTSNYFQRLAMWTGMPTIPVFNASQKSSVFIDVASDENGSTPNIVTHMVRLKTNSRSNRKSR